MTDALRSITASIDYGRDHPRACRDCPGGANGPIVPRDFVARILKATMKKGRPALALAGSKRDAWEEDLACAILGLAIGDTVRPNPTNEALDRLATRMDETAAAIRESGITEGSLIDLELRLILCAERIRLRSRRRRGDRTDARKNFHVARLLRLYEEAFAHTPSILADGPSARLVERASKPKKRPSYARS